MLSTSFIVARQPTKSRQEGFSRNSVNSPNLVNYEPDNARDWLGRGRETACHTQETDYQRTDRASSKTRETSLKKIGRSLSMSKRGDTIRNTSGKVQAKSGRSVSQTRDPQQLGSQATWDRNNQGRNTERFQNLSIKEDGEGATKFGYSYNPALYGTVGGDARSVFAIQSRPLPDPLGEKTKFEKSLYENINRFTSVNRVSQDMTSLQQAQVTYARNGTSSPYGTRSRIPVYKPRVDQSLDTRMGQRAVTQMEISRTYENPSRLAHSSSAQEDNVVKKGLMWIQQDKLFSRWKERFIILTNGYLQIFKKGATRFSDMGTFISKIKLSGIGSIALEDKRGYLTLLLTTSFPQEGKLLLRKTEGLKDWHDSVVSCCQKERQKKSSLPTEEFWNRKQLSESCGFENWISARDILGSTLEDSPCSSIGRPYRAPTSLQRAENLYSDSRDYSGIDTSGHSLVSPLASPLASPLSTLSDHKVHTMTNHSPVRLHQAMFSPPKPMGTTQRQRY